MFEVIHERPFVPLITAKLRLFVGSTIVYAVAVTLAFIVIAVVSVFWTFTLPVFQSPDEPTHFDMALSIAKTGRPVAAREGVPSDIAQNETAALLRDTNFEDIAFDRARGVPFDYGTAKYWLWLDERNQRDAARNSCDPRCMAHWDDTLSGQIDVPAPPPHSKLVNWLTSIYPPGYYSAEAVLIKVASTGGSIVRGFYGARLGSNAFFLLGLLFGLLCARALEWERWSSLAVVLVCGLFPLNSMLSASVQPDNGAFAVLMGTLLASIVFIRNGRATVWQYAAVGLCLALCATFKYQVLVAAAAGAYAVTASRMMTSRATLAARLKCLAALTVPWASAFWALRILAWQPQTLAMAGIHSKTTLQPFKAALGNPTQIWQVIFVRPLEAFAYFFVSGISATSYWEIHSWLGLKILFFQNPSASDQIEMLMILATRLIIVLLVAAAVTAIVRITLAWRAGHARNALAALLSDPLWIAYYVYAAFFIALFVATGNGFGGRGRNWFAVSFLAFAVAIQYAPRVLRRLKLTPVIRACTCAVLLAYVGVSAYYAYFTVIDRYYSDYRRFDTANDLGRLEHTSVGLGGLDEQLRGDEAYVTMEKRTTLPAYYSSQILHTGGWALPLNERLRGVELLLDGVPYATLSGLNRPELEEELRREGFLRGDHWHVGFEGFVPLSHVRFGAHKLTGIAVEGDGGRYYVLKDPRLIDVVDPSTLAKTAVYSERASTFKRGAVIWTGYTSPFEDARARSNEYVSDASLTVIGYAQSNMGPMVHGIPDARVGAVVAKIDNAPPLLLDYGIDMYGLSPYSLLRSGFRGQLELRKLKVTPGTHVLRVFVVPAGKPPQKAFLLDPPRISFSVINRNRDF